MTPADLPALILAGGLGTRLRPVVSDLPKVLASVSGRAFVYYLLDQLVDAGVRSIFMCTGYLADSVERLLGDSYRGSALHYSREDSPLGTGGAIRLALPRIQGDAALVLNGDSHCPVSLDALCARHREYGAQATMVLSRAADTRRFGRVSVGPDGQITSFSEKSESSQDGWVNAGIYVLNRKVIESIPSGRPASIEREIFPELIGRGLFGFCTDGELLDIGVPETYSLAQTVFRSQARKRPDHEHPV